MNATTLLPLMMQRLDAECSLYASGAWHQENQDEPGDAVSYLCAGTEIISEGTTDELQCACAALRNMLAPLCKIVAWVEMMHRTNEVQQAALEPMAQAALDAMRDAMPEQYAQWLAEVA